MSWAGKTLTFMTQILGIRDVDNLRHRVHKVNPLVLYLLYCGPERKCDIMKPIFSHVVTINKNTFKPQNVLKYHQWNHTTIKARHCPVQNKKFCYY